MHKSDELTPGPLGGSEALRKLAEQLARKLKVGKTCQPPATKATGWPDFYADVPWEEGVQAILDFAAVLLPGEPPAPVEASELTKLAIAELAGYRDGFEGLPYVQSFNTSDENLAYALWFGKARAERTHLVDTINLLDSKLKEARASHVGEPPAPQITCPACGTIVKQVASATLDLALWQHWNWVCKVAAHGEPPAPARDALVKLAIGLLSRISDVAGEEGLFIAGDGPGAGFVPNEKAIELITRFVLSIREATPAREALEKWNRIAKAALALTDELKRECRPTTDVVKELWAEIFIDYSPPTEADIARTREEHND